MRDQFHFEKIKGLVDLTYNNFGNSLVINKKPFNPISPELSYSFKYIGSGGYTTYQIVHSETKDDFIDERVLMHEYGHIYLTHLDGIHEILDGQILWLIQNYREELIEYINKSCGIDFADKLLERVIDDPKLNHSLHSVAMDMEVNTKILSLEDIEEVEKRISPLIPNPEAEYLKYVKDHIENEDIKKDLEEKISAMEKKEKLKFIHPSKFHYPDGTPFKDNLTYEEYLIEIIKNLNQFIKMLMSISSGGSGDTSEISDQALQDLFGEGGEQSLDDLLDSCGLGDGEEKRGGNEEVDSPYKGMYEEDKGGKGMSGKDHENPDRQEADKKRELGQIRHQGGAGCGKSGAPDATREVRKEDPIEMALEEVFHNFKSKVVKFDSERDLLRKYNLGINRTIISPTYSTKITISSKPTVVFLIDISGSMDTRLVDRCLGTISKKMRKLFKGLRYNIITWSTELGEHIQDIDPRKGVPRISMGGGTRLAKGIRFFKENYSKDAILIIISDFEDNLEDWHREEEGMKGYTMYGFNYGWNNYRTNFTNLIVKDFTKRE